jgi:hypothetical protein
VWDDPAQVVIRDLPAGVFEIRVTAKGRNEGHEELDIIVYHCEKPKLQVVQAASDFAKAMLISPKDLRIADDAIGVPCKGRWDVYLSGEQLDEAHPVPSWFLVPHHGVDRAEEAWVIGDSVGGIAPASPWFAVAHLASSTGLVGFRVSILDRAPETPVGPTDDSTSIELYSESGKVAIFDGNVTLIESVPLGRPGKYGLRMIAHNRDPACWEDQDSKYPVSRETWDLELWPLANGEAVAPQAVATTEYSKLRATLQEQERWDHANPFDFDEGIE